MVAKIGISAIGSGLGKGGGTDVYTLNLVRALSSVDTEHRFELLVDYDSVDQWAFLRGSANVSIRAITTSKSEIFNHSLAPIRTFFGKEAWTWRPRESALATKIDSLALDLIHFPRTSIYPLSISTAAVLTFFDLQHVVYPLFFSRRARFARTRRYRHSLEISRRVIAPSKYTQDTLVEHLDVSPRRTTVIPVGIDKNWGLQSQEQIQLVKTKYNLPEEYVFYPANPWPHKNHARLLNAINLCSELYEIKPTVVFTGRLLGETRSALAIAASLGLEEQVLDLGFVEMADLPALYHAASMLVFPSLFEGFGIPLLEAMSCGCPIAAANATSVPEVVGDAALLFDPVDDRMIAEAIMKVYSDPELRSDLVQKGFSRVRSFHWNDIAPKIIDLYNAVLDDG